MKLAIMQPYFFPYIGYFQLINAVDKFIFYDDVNFIKNGWINRNRILINNSIKYITVQLKGASPFKLINEVEYTDNKKKISKSIEMAYKKAPYYSSVWPIIVKCLEYNTQKICDLALFSLETVSKYLNLKTQFEISSHSYYDIKNIEKSERIIEICKRNNALIYINPIGGQKIYNKHTFINANINLYFLKTNFIQYKQYSNEFIPALSIIDVMMFNSVEDIQKMLDNYELV